MNCRFPCRPARVRRARSRNVIHDRTGAPPVARGALRSAVPAVALAVAHVLAHLLALAGSGAVQAQVAPDPASQRPPSASAAPPDAAAAASNRGAAAALPAAEVTGVRETATGPVPGYAARRSASATKTDTPLRETPQAVTVIPRERVEDQGATGLQDALNYAAGVRSDSYGLDSRNDGVAIRGSEPAFYLDGLRQQLGGYYTSTTRTEPYTLERIEVLRGPSGILFGQGSVGGLVHMVSKRPHAGARSEIGTQIGSFDRVQVQADLNGAIGDGDAWRYRIVALGRRSGTQVDHVRDDRLVLAPSLSWQPDGRTNVTLLALWQDDESGSTAQFLPWSGTAAPNPNGRIPTERFIGEPGFDRYDSRRRAIGWSIEWPLGDRWQLRQNLRVSHNEVDALTSYGDFYSDPSLRLSPYLDADQRLLARAYFGGLTRQRVVAADQHAEGRFDLGPTQHRVLLGLDVLRARQDGHTVFDFTSSAGGGVPPIDVYAPVYRGYVVPPATPSPLTTQRQLGLYLQDQIAFARHWRVVAGLRRDRAASGVAGSPDEKSAATTRRLALLYAAPAGWSPYLSYSEAFTPVAGVDLAGRRFRPQTGEQVELGLKYQPEGSSFGASVAVFDLREKNRLVADPANPMNRLQAGATRNRGVEVELAGRVLPQLDIAAHYNHLDMEPDAAGNLSYYNPLPRHQAALWGKYSFSLGGRPGWSVAAGVRMFSAVRDGDAPPTPRLALVDAALAYDAGEWRYALNVQNLADKVYYPVCLQRGDCFAGARRHLTASVTRRF